MRIVYILLSVGFGYWLGHSPKVANPVSNCPSESNVTVTAVTYPSVSPSPSSNKTSVEPVTSPTPTSSASPSEEDENYKNSPNTVERHKEKIEIFVSNTAQDLLWRTKNAESDSDKAVTIAIEKDDMEDLEAFRQGLKDGNMYIESEKEVHLGNFVYEIVVRANP